jgi:hypothetical protein
MRELKTSPVQAVSMKEVWTGFALVHSLQQRPDGATALVTVRPTSIAINFHVFSLTKATDIKLTIN